MAARWGSFLQQAVAGVESRLDNILGETEDISQPAKPGTSSPVSGTPVQPETGAPRKVSSNSAANDRLQERLARAIAAKNHAPSTSNAPSRVGNPAAVTESPRPSFDAASVKNEKLAEDQSGMGIGAKDNLAINGGSKSDSHNIQEDGSRPIGIQPVLEAAALSQTACKPDSVRSPRLSGDISRQTEDPQGSKDTVLSPEAVVDDNVSLPEAFQPLNAMHHSSRPSSAEIDSSEQERQNEIHGYIERIDALQAKLQYLSRDSAESARKAAAAAIPGTLERRLAEKDEQIALLLEEGQQLSKVELKHMTVIKKLRLMASEADKRSQEVQKQLHGLEKDKAAFTDRLQHTDAIERQLNERQRLVTQLHKDMEVVKTERDVRDRAITELKSQLVEAVSQAKAEEVKSSQDLLKRERRRVMDLGNDISALKIEKELAAGRYKAQLDELRASGERKAERARVAELEMQAEQQILEGRLEILRTRAEEFSSCAAGDSQAKLLRQIETLQSQYAIASENWQRIEASLSSRATNLEKERDEALKRETEIRKKAREVKAKRIEEALEDTETKRSSFQSELLEQSEQIVKLQQRAEEAEISLQVASKAFEHAKEEWALELQHRIEEEKTKWREELIGQGSYSYSRGDSPVPSARRNLTAEYLGLQNLQVRKPSAQSVTNESFAVEKLLSPRSSGQPMRLGSGRGTPTTPVRLDSMPMSSEDLQDMPSLQPIDNEDYFDHIVTTSSPQDKLNDMMSISTIGAGPSVQFVERMGAAVRRLESEKLATKEELLRLSGQRDKARAEVVSLMQEVETSKTFSTKIKALEDDNVTIYARYQTTLEMLGEKSELVEELKADVQDVKAMYRELVERTIK